MLPNILLFLFNKLQNYYTDLIMPCLTIFHKWGISKIGSNSSVFQNIRTLPNEDLPCGPVVKNPPFHARDAGSILGQGTNIPHAEGQLSHLPECHNY